MDIFLRYLQVFLVGGIVCFIGQILINKTKMTSARILVLFLTLGVVLEAVGAFRYIKEFGSSGITVPIIGFGSSLAKGAIEGAKYGIIPAVLGGLQKVAGGLTAAIVFGFIFSVIYKSKTKRM